MDADLGKALTWRCFCAGKNGTEYIEGPDFYPFEGMNEWSESILEFWVIADYGLSELISEGLSQMGSVGIVGLYATIIVSLGALVRKIVPPSYNIAFMTLSDPLPLLQLINVMEICRITNYPYLYRLYFMCSNHPKDEFRIWYVVMKIFRSPDLLVRFTKKPPVQGVICDADDLPIA